MLQSGGMCAFLYEVAQFIQVPQTLFQLIEIQQRLEYYVAKSAYAFLHMNLNTGQMLYI